MLRRHLFPAIASLFASAVLSAQETFPNGLSTHRVADGINVPLQLGFDAAGRLFMGSGATDSSNGDKVEVFRMDTDGTVTSLNDLVFDPDSLAIGPDGFVYTGAYGGRIFRIDPDAGVRRLWVHDTALGNIDGMAWFGGDLYTVAFDHPRVYRVDAAALTASLFADLSTIGFTGMTGIAFDPWQPRVFIGSPLENRITELDLAGNVLNSAFADGFTFVGHLAFDLSGRHGEDCFAADNGGASVFRIDSTSGAVSPYLRHLDPLTGGLAFDAEGDLFASKITNDGSLGELWAVRAFTLELVGDLRPGFGATPAELIIRGEADVGRWAMLFASFDGTGFDLRDGRRFPIGPKVLFQVARKRLPAAGEDRWSVPPLFDYKFLRGESLYFAALSWERGVWRGITEGLRVDVPANQPPVADAGSDSNSSAGSPVVFDGSASFDPDMDALKYDWDFGDDNFGTGSVLEHIYESPGTYTAILTVGDGLAESTDQLVITVN